MYIKLLYRHLLRIVYSKSPNGYRNDSVLLLKALLQWLVNCSINKCSLYNHHWFSYYLRHTISMHINVSRQKYNVNYLKHNIMATEIQYCCTTKLLSLLFRFTSSPFSTTKTIYTCLSLQSVFLYQLQP